MATFGYIASNYSQVVTVIYIYYKCKSYSTHDFGTWSTLNVSGSEGTIAVIKDTEVNPTEDMATSTPFPGTERASTTTAVISTTRDTSDDRITFGGQGREPGKFGGKLVGKPLAVSPSNEMFVTDRENRRIQVFNMTGGFLRQFATGRDWEPLALCIARAGKRPGGVWVLARPARRQARSEDDGFYAIRYDKDGHVLNRSKLDPVKATSSVIASDASSDRIIVLWHQCQGYSEDKNCAVVVFHPFGHLFRMFGDISRPYSLTVDKHGNVYVLESWRRSIYKFNKFGRPLSIFQRRPEGTGYLEWPNDVCSDGSRHFFVTDGPTEPYRVQKFTGHGDFIRTIAEISADQTKVALCREGRFVVISGYTVTIIRNYSGRYDDAENGQPVCSLILQDNNTAYSMADWDSCRYDTSPYSTNGEHQCRNSTATYSANDGDPEWTKSCLLKTKLGVLYTKNSAAPVEPSVTHESSNPDVVTRGSSGRSQLDLDTVTTDENFIDRAATEDPNVTHGDSTPDIATSGSSVRHEHDLDTITTEENSLDDVEPYAVTYSYDNELQYRLADSQGHHSSENQPSPSEGAKDSSGLSNLRCAPDSLRPNPTYEADDPERASEGVGADTTTQDRPRPNPQNTLRPNPMYGKGADQQAAGVYRYRWHIVLVVSIVLAGLIISAYVAALQSKDIRTSYNVQDFGNWTTLNFSKLSDTTAVITGTDITEVSPMTYKPLGLVNSTEDFESTPLPYTERAVISSTGDTSDDRITFGGEGTEPGKFGRELVGKPLAVSPSNEMFVTDHENRRIQVFNMTGGFLRHFSTGDWDPLALCIARTGDMWILMWPAWKPLRGKDDRPHAVKYSKDGQVSVRFNMDPIRVIQKAIVADTLSDNIIVLWNQCRAYSKDKNCAVVVFGPDGTLERMFGDISKPYSVTVDKDGNVYVLENWYHSIYKFNKFGSLLSIFQRRPQGTGYLEWPNDICSDGLGHLIVTDGLTKYVQFFTGFRVQMITRYGEYIRTIAKLSTDQTQTKVALCTGGRLVVISGYTVTIIRNYSGLYNGTYVL
uniref:Uncharacterized protein n=1 Tax=Branchiostoma floridae TaxID=7739 RepID=C3ZIB4_BRAFL|eukprot:XP_002591628.1 hypothetical protein BRAFLDRAFT_80727 [Branchiostoma floridae]